MFWERGGCTENHIYCSCLKDRDDQIDALVDAARAVVDAYESDLALWGDGFRDIAKTEPMYSAVDALRAAVEAAGRGGGVNDE